VCSPPTVFRSCDRDPMFEAHDAELGPAVTGAATTRLSDDLPVRRRNPAWSRVALAAIGAVYAGVLWSSYKRLVPDIYDGFGHGIRELPGYAWPVSLFLIVLPASQLPTASFRPSTLLVNVQFWLIYVPACVLLWHTSRPALESKDVLVILALCATGMSVMIAASRVPVRRLWSFHVSERSYDALLLASWGLGAAVLVLSSWRNFQLGGLSDIYDLRAALVEQATLRGSRIGFYALTVLSGAILPLVFANAVHRRLRLTGALVLLSYVLLFGFGGNKASLVAVVLLPLLAAAAGSTALRLAFALPLFLCCALAGGIPVAALWPDTAGIVYVAAIHSRTFSVPSLLIAQYVEFFRNNPTTLFSHVSPFNLFIHYPFDDDLPYVVGRYFYDFPIGANAGLWAGDGIAALGLPGIILVSVVAATFFWLLDCAAAGVDSRIAVVSLTYIALTFTNISFFTTLGSGGLLLIFLAFSIAPRPRQAATAPLP
jgi:hypothetical protein